MVLPETVLAFLCGMMILLSTIQFFVGYFLGYNRAKKEFTKFTHPIASVQPLCKYAKE